jgi:hypothetical protein
MFMYNLQQLTQNETVPSCFSPECPDSSHLLLHMTFLEPKDSAVYLCASSQDTALQSHHLLVQKPTGPSRKLWELRSLLNISCKTPDRSYKP